MPENWKPFICRVNGKLASILVDLGLRESAPVPSKPWLLWVWVYFKTPRSDGLSDGKEAPTLYEIDDALYLHVNEKCRALLGGTITTEGRREFYFYAEVLERFEQAVETAMAGFEGYKFAVGNKKDPQWDQYLNVLYASAEDPE